MVATLALHIITHLPTPEGWKAELALLTYLETAFVSFFFVEAAFLSASVHSISETLRQPRPSSWTPRRRRRRRQPAATESKSQHDDAGAPTSKQFRSVSASHSRREPLRRAASRRPAGGSCRNRRRPRRRNGRRCKRRGRLPSSKLLDQVGQRHQPRRFH